MKLSLALIVLSLATQAFAEFDLKIQQASPAVERFKQDVISRLPRKMISALNKEIQLRFDGLDNFQSLQNPCETRESHQLFGWVNKNVITLNKNFLPYLENPNLAREDFSCGHRNYYKLAQATLIHELAHIYDKNQGDVSTKSLYLALSHSGKNLLGIPKTKNRKTDRLPDPYEIKNVPEHFAVNVEFFLLDPKYSCHRPNLSSYFSSLFEVERESCPTFGKVRIYNGKTTEQHDLSPANVKAIHYLMADKGKAIMSRFGHAMFRIETFNSNNDLVVGFSGQPDDTVIDGFKGLTGKYASRVTFKPLKNVIDEYTKGELRGLTSYPLKFTHEQKINFLNEVLTLHWEYAGRYFFFTTNCATEAMTLLKASTQTEDVLKKKIMTPLGLRKILRQTKLITDDNATRFPSYEETLVKVYQRVAPLMSAQNYKSYMKTSALNRRAIFESLNSVERVQLYAFLSIELTLNKRAQKNLENKLMKLVHDLPDNHAIKKISDETIRLSNELSFGHNVAAGYGIPLASEIKLTADSYYTTTETRLGELFNEMGLWLRDEKSELLDELKLGQENLVYLQQRLKDLK